MIDKVIQKELELKKRGKLNTLYLTEDESFSKLMSSKESLGESLLELVVLEETLTDPLYVFWFLFKEKWMKIGCIVLIHNPQRTINYSDIITCFKNGVWVGDWFIFEMQGYYAGVFPSQRGLFFK